MKLMIGKDLKKHWKETYGVDFAGVAGDNSGVRYYTYLSNSFQKTKNFLWHKWSVLGI